MTAGQDVACRTSFSSSILNTTQHLDKALRETAHADFGVGEFNFLRARDTSHPNLVLRVLSIKSYTLVRNADTTLQI